MTKITYVEHSGVVHVVEVADGLTVMEGARKHNIPGIVADCGGACACATCHAYVHPSWVARMPIRGSLESEMLEFAWSPDSVLSRLTCQLIVTDALDGLVVLLPERQT